jgi:hypothetical protein
MLRLAQIVVDHRDRDLAQDLVEIGLRVIEAVDQRRPHQQDEGSTGREHAAPFGGEGSADSARRGRGRRRRGRRTQRTPCECAQAQQREQRVANRRFCHQPDIRRNGLTELLNPGVHHRKSCS